MPILEICEEGVKKLTPMDALMVYATMFYPGDDGKRERMFLTYTLDMKILELGDDPSGWKDINGLFAWTMAMLFKETSVTQVREEMWELLLPGLKAGWLLFDFMQAMRHTPENASMNKIVHMNIGAGWSRSKILSNWAKFRSVAHLWLAFYFCWDRQQDTFWHLLGDEEDESCEELRKFLDFAESFRVWGEQTSPNGTPILLAEQSWRTPPHLELPTGPIVLDKLPEPTADYWEKIKSYKAPSWRGR